MKTLTISNLNNAVRFYTALFGVRPTELSVWSARYRIGPQIFSLQEGTPTEVQIHNFQVLDLQFIPTYHRMKSLIHSICTFECELLKDTIRLTDADGHIWVVSSKPVVGADLEAFRTFNKCYIEPIFLN